MKNILISVVQQRYEVQVYDEFVISGNTAVLRCHIPSYVRDYVAVVTWEREDGVTITSNVAVGELVRDVIDEFCSHYILAIPDVHPRISTREFRSTSRTTLAETTNALVLLEDIFIIY